LRHSCDECAGFYDIVSTIDEADIRAESQTQFWNLSRSTAIWEYICHL